MNRGGLRKAINTIVAIRICHQLMDYFIKLLREPLGMCISDSKRYQIRTEYISSILYRQSFWRASKVYFCNSGSELEAIQFLILTIFQGNKFPPILPSESLSRVIDASIWNSSRQLTTFWYLWKCLTVHHILAKRISQIIFAESSSTSSEVYIYNSRSKLEMV